MKKTAAYLRVMLFPPMRGAFTWTEIILPGILMLLYVLVWFMLQLFDIVLFTRPGMLWLIIVFPWIWWMHRNSFSGLSPWRGYVSLVLRIGLTGLLIMIIAEPRAIRTNRDLTVLYALDISDSIGEPTVDSALEYILKTASKKPEDDRTGLVVFGWDAAVELPPRMSFPFEAINSRISRDGTDLEKALHLSLAVMPDDTSGKIVLISDGAATEGALTGVIGELNARGISVDVLPIEYQHDREVWLEKLELPRSVQKGETYEAGVVLAALDSGNGTLVLNENGQDIYQAQVNWQEGKNRFVLPIYMRQPGFYEYQARIIPAPGEDGWDKNNTAMNYIYLKGEGKVLLIPNPIGDDRDTEHLIQALKEADRIIEIMEPYDMPRDAFSLIPYDSIILANVPADAFDMPQLTAIRDAVYNQGVGLLMLGGEDSYGPGGYHRTPVEEALPVTMDTSQKKVLPKGALAIILHTCEFPEGNTWGKRIAKEAIRVLGAKDEVGILVYNWSNNSTGEEWLFPLTPAGEYEKLYTLINNAQIGDMPSFQSTMQMGLEGLKANDAAMKHMIIISDGDPQPPTPELIAGYQKAKISISMIAIHPHGGRDISVMQSIAKSTGGRYYFPQNPNLLPSIFIKEAKTLRRSMIQNITFVPTVEFPSPVLKGIDVIPDLKGYVLTTAKGRSRVVLKGPEEDQVDPVLATWRFGLGKAAAFTSDLAPNWGISWLEWEHYKAFVKQLMTDISKVTKKSKLFMQVFADGNDGVVIVEDHQAGFDLLDMNARISGPRDRMETLRLRQIAPGRYEGVFPLWGRGRYQVMAQGDAGERQEQAMSGFAVPYSPEYMRFRSDPAVLEHLADATGGRMLNGSETAEELFPAEREERATSKPVFDLFLIVLACLIPLDIAIRRIQIDLLVLKRMFGFKSREQHQEKTLGALLKVKKRIESNEDHRPVTLSPAAHKPVRKTAVSQKQMPKKEEIKPQKADSIMPEDGSTTGRLLAARRKRQQDNEKDT